MEENNEDEDEGNGVDNCSCHLKYTIREASDEYMMKDKAKRKMRGRRRRRRKRRMTIRCNAQQKMREIRKEIFGIALWTVHQHSTSFHGRNESNPTSSVSLLPYSKKS